MLIDQYQVSKTDKHRLTFIDCSQQDNPSWDVEGVLLIGREDWPNHQRITLEVEYDEFEYDGNDPAMWSVGKDVIWSYQGDVFEGIVDTAEPRMEKMTVEIVV